MKKLSLTCLSFMIIWIFFLLSHANYLHLQVYYSIILYTFWLFTLCRWWRTWWRRNFKSLSLCYTHTHKLYTLICAPVFELTFFNYLHIHIHFYHHWHVPLTVSYGQPRVMGSIALKCVLLSSLFLVWYARVSGGKDFFKSSPIHATIFNIGKIWLKEAKYALIIC